MITCTCAACGQTLRVKDDLAGKRGKCPRCGQPVQVPRASAAPVPPAGGDDVDATQELPATPMPPRVDDDGADTITQPASGRVAAAGPPTPAPDKTWVTGKVSPELIARLAPGETPDEIGRLGGYRVLRVLGAGGMGVVLQAEDVQLQRPVALKVMRPDMAADELARQRFVREARSAAAIEHDHIVAIHQVGEDRGLPFLAMQFLKGEPLSARLKRERKLPVAEALRIAREVAEGLAAAHRHGLIHRDIKPDNIWLETTAEDHGRAGARARVKILDFGLARPVDEQTHLTQQGAIIGTPMYMAPEQAAGQDLDARCDLFSLGCILYRMLTGKLAFIGKDTLMTLVAVATKQPPEPSELDPDVPPAVSRLVMRLLAKKPDQRPQSADEVAEAIATLEEDAKEAPSARRGPAVVVADEEDEDVADDEEAGAAGRSRGVMIALVGVAALVIVGGAGLAAWLLKDRLGGPKTAGSTAPGGQVGGTTATADQAARAATEWALDLGGYVRVVLAGGETRDLHKPDTAELPAGSFRVDSINLAGLDKATDAGLQHLVGLRDLKRLMLTGTSVTDAGLVHLKDLSGLEALWLNDTAVSDAGIASLTQLTGLTYLNLLNTPVTDAGLKQLKDALPRCKLEGKPARPSAPSPVAADRGVAEWVLKKGGKVFITSPFDAGLREVRRVQDLPVLDFQLLGVSLADRKDVGDAQLKELEKATHVRSLALDGTAVTDAGLGALRGMTGLTGLSLVGTEVTGTGLHVLRTFQGLTDLNLSNAPVGDGGLDHIARLTTLQRLTLNDTRVGDAGLENLRQLTNLRHLYLDNTRTTDAGLASLANLTQLIDLSLAGTRITGPGLRNLRQCGQLRTLVLAGAKVKDVGVEHLKGMLSLNYLDLDGSSVTDQGLDSIKTLVRLQTLHLANAPITDAGIPRLKELPNLADLSLEGTRVTLAGLKELAGLESLKHLNIKGVQISEVEYFELKQALSGCEIAR